LYPKRVLKLVFLDAAYDYSAPAFQEMLEKHPLRKFQPPGLDEDYFTPEDYIAAMKRAYPALAAIWGELMDEHALHEITKTPEGKVVDKMSDAIGAAINDTVNHYVPEDAKIKAPVLSIYTISNGRYYISDDWMTEEQKAQVHEFFDTVRSAWERENIEGFRRSVPHARIVEIPEGHHYCFIKAEEAVFEAMRDFLAEVSLLPGSQA
jgi:pimeloyl-ACP methyl ester carboxylesterase